MVDHRAEQIRIILLAPDFHVFGIFWPKIPHKFQLVQTFVEDGRLEYKKQNSLPSKLRVRSKSLKREAREPLKVLYAARACKTTCYIQYNITDVTIYTLAILAYYNLTISYAIENLRLISNTML